MLIRIRLRADLGYSHGREVTVVVEIMKERGFRGWFHDQVGRLVEGAVGRDLDELWTLLKL